MAYQINHFINGQSTKKAKTTLAVFNPALGETIGEVSVADEQQINAAVDAAHTAFPAWSSTSPLKRARVLFKFKELLEKNMNELAALVTTEHGKTLDDAKGSVLRGIELVEYCCGIPKLLQGSFSENVSAGIDSYTIRQALGVCAGVSPFNFPVMVPVWMSIPAIACGNTFVLKPSERAPSAPYRLAELLHESGLPNGVFNVVNGDKSTVDTLLGHHEIVAMTAVASTPVAESIYQKAITSGKRAHTFGGAKNHCIVMPDADVEQAADAIVGAAYGSAGERCMALSAVIAVGDAVADELVKHIQRKAKQLKVGVGDDPSSQMGPLITQEHCQRVKEYIQLGEKESADLLIDGRDLVVRGYEKGFFLGPCLFDHVKENMQIYKDEIFGPVLIILRVNDFESALKLINQHQYGNGTAIFTQNGRIARAFASQVQVGMVGINVPIPVPVAYHSFGGWKRSIFGDIGMHGEQSVQFYTKLKTVTQRWPKTAEMAVDYAMPTQ